MQLSLSLTILILAATAAPAILAAQHALPAPAASAVTALSPEEIMRRTLENASASADARKHQEYTYKKHVILEEMDGGKVDERQEKTIHFQDGTGTVVSMSINGRPLPPEAIRKHEEKLNADRAKLSGGGSPGRSDSWETLLNVGMLKKYQFHLAGQDTFRGRPVHVIRFAPLSGELPVEKFTDRVLNRLSGTLWIDAQDHQIAKAKVSMQGEATLWGGILANLSRFNFHLERMRLPDGTWFNSLTFGEYAGRKLVDNFHFRTRSETQGLRKVQQASR